MKIIKYYLMILFFLPAYFFEKIKVVDFGSGREGVAKLMVLGGLISFITWAVLIWFVLNKVQFSISLR